MSKQGYLVVSDITGYTAYLSQAELGHAQEILTELLESVLDSTLPPLIISRLEGDAIFAYAPGDAFLKGMTLVEALENTYGAFRQALRRVELNTDCECNACRNISNLDLKSFVHSGEYMLQTIGGFTELLGNDVNLLFRLTKNNIPEETGLSAYAAYSEAAISALGIEGLAALMLRHREEYEHLGEVTVFVQDMHAVWERSRHEHEQIIEPDEALVVAEVEFPMEQSLAWEYVSNPEYRRTMLGSDRQELKDLVDGRVDRGSTYICYHGDIVLPQVILDWHPFRYYTFSSPDLMMPSVTGIATIALLPTAEGTRVSWRVSASEGSRKDVRKWEKMMRQEGQQVIEGLLIAVRQRAIDDMAAGRVARASETKKIPAGDIRAAIRERLSSS
jgi:hypothetical protein